MYLAPSTIREAIEHSRSYPQQERVGEKGPGFRVQEDRVRTDVAAGLGTAAAQSLFELAGRVGRLLKANQISVSGFMSGGVGPFQTPGCWLDPPP